MNIVELLKLKPPFRIGRIDAEMVTAPLIEWGTNKKGNVVFGSFATNDGLTSFIAYTQIRHSELDYYIACNYKNVEKCVDTDSTQPYLKGSMIPLISQTSDCYLDSKVKWPSFTEENDIVKLEITAGPTVCLSIINRSMLLKCFQHFKDTSKPASDATIAEITNRIAEEDLLPEGATVIQEFDYYNIGRQYKLIDRYNVHGPFIRDVCNWKVKLVQYKGRLTIFVSPDAGLYRFKPIYTLQSILDKRTKVTIELSSIMDMLVIPSVARPLSGRNRDHKFSMLYDPKFQLSTYLINKVIWPILVPSRQIVAIIHVTPASLCDTINIFGSYESNVKRFVISKYKTSTKLAVSDLYVRSNTSIEYWLTGSVKAGMVSEMLMDDRIEKAVWLSPDITYEELIKNLQLTHALNSI